MKSIVRFEKVNGIKILLFQCSDFSSDGSFTTYSILRNKSSNHYTSHKIGYNSTRIIPKVSYETFIETKDYKEANLLSISYYMGNDTKDIVESIDSKTFIIDERIPVEYRIPNETEYKKGRVNNILKYIGLDHVKKPLDKVKFEGDCYSKIELLKECKFSLYKSLKVK